jgi:hypothetical protein
VNTHNIFSLDEVPKQAGIAQEFSLDAASTPFQVARGAREFLLS